MAKKKKKHTADAAADNAASLWERSKLFRGGSWVVVVGDGGMERQTDRQSEKRDRWRENRERVRVKAAVSTLLLH